MRFQLVLGSERLLSTRWPALAAAATQQVGQMKGPTIMNVSDAQPCVCGGENVQAARTERWGDGDEAVLYLQYLLKCARCGRLTEDGRMRFLNAAGFAGA